MRTPTLNSITSHSPLQRRVTGRPPRKTSLASVCGDPASLRLCVINSLRVISILRHSMSAISSNSVARWLLLAISLGDSMRSIAGNRVRAIFGHGVCSIPGARAIPSNSIAWRVLLGINLRHCVMNRLRVLLCVSSVPRDSVAWRLLLLVGLRLRMVNSLCVSSIPGHGIARRILLLVCLRVMNCLGMSLGVVLSMRLSMIFRVGLRMIFRMGLRVVLCFMWLHRSPRMIFFAFLNRLGDRDGLHIALRTSFGVSDGD